MNIMLTKKKIRRSLFFLLIALLSPFILIGLLILFWILRALMYTAMNYPVDVPPATLAQQIIDKKLSVDRCEQLQQAFPVMGPSVGEKRLLCIYTYAQLTHDPRVCIRLMPSSYGISCIGEVWGKASLSGDCYDENVPNGASMECIGIDGYVWIGSNCSEVREGELRDECIGKQAVKKGDSALCSSIENPVLKSVCEVRIELQKKYPGIQELR